MLDKIKTIRSHTGKARFLAMCDENPLGYIPRQRNIPSPYAYSPVETVWHHEDVGPVIIKETSHKVYDVYRVPLDWIDTEAHATETYLYQEEING